MPSVPAPRRITDSQFDELVANARLIEKSGSREKVYLTADDDIIKLTYRKRLLSSALLSPYARRFWRNAHRLHERGIHTVRCRELCYQPSRQRHLVIYPRLPGETLRERLARDEPANVLLKSMATFLATLHRKGIYFRSVHFGNVLIDDDGRFGLIDVADVRFASGPLSPLKRARNFRHLLHDTRDIERLDQFGFDRFLGIYLTHCGLDSNRTWRLRRWIHRFAPAFVPECCG